MPRLRPALLHALGQLQRTSAAASFGLATHDPERAQRRKLRDILSRAHDTRFGRAHGLTAQASAEDFARQVPLMTSTELAPWVSSQMNGEPNVLTTERPIYYVRTTGSTGAPKHVPITPSYRAEFQKTVHVSLFHLYLRFPEAFTSTALYFVGSRRVARAPDGCDIGTMSGFNFTELPPVVRAIYAWPYELFEVADLRTRTYLALWLATTEDLSLVAGIFPAPIVYLLRDLAELAPTLARDVRAGRLPDWLVLEPAQRDFFTRRCAPNPAAARRLERAAAAPEEEKAIEAWPSLRLVYCWTTATAALYLPELQRRLPGVAVRDAIYSACEGWASIPIGDERPGGALAIESVYFEFLDPASGAVHRAWELEDGRQYLIVLTTSAGLYRYALGDVVEVCGFHHQTPRIRFVRKNGAASNLAGEKLEEEHVNRAVGDALRALGVEATYFSLAPLLARERPGYALYLEPRAPLADALAARLRASVDENLGAASFDYARLRSGSQLLPLELKALAQGTYATFRQQRVGDGSAEAQLKIAHLVSDPASLPFAR
ncbi:MAG: GH3 auxin-responsive promoter family protein [Archangiaceae bacterium]|nr:GH3 auxin-responsive promoter family protein [Archangiaceae bacterium]